MQRGQGGFSVVESMIAVAVMGLLLALAVPTARDYMLNLRIRSGAEALQSGLQAARAEAVKRNANVEFILLGTGTTYSIQLASDSSELQARGAEEGTANIQIVPTPADANRVTFDGLGRRARTNADGSAVLTRVLIDIDPAVLDPSRSRDLRLDIGIGGEVRMCDPNVSATTDSRYCA